jgi:2',3'-cyclic-nucleotide 2'-phosphodiesterase (5'-nucleotidase family)
LLLAALTVAPPSFSAPLTFDNTKARTEETSFGDLVADAVREAAKADVALVNAGATHPATATVEGGDLEPLTGLLVCPDEKIAALSLTGQQVLQALERGLSALPTPSNGFLQVSGLKVTFAAGAPAGARVRTATVPQTGKPVDPQAKYRVAALLSLAKGGQGYFMVFGRDAVVETQDTGVRDALEAYASVTKRLTALQTGRLEAVKE